MGFSLRRAIMGVGRILAELSPLARKMDIYRCNSTVLTIHNNYIWGMAKGIHY